MKWLVFSSHLKYSQFVFIRYKTVPPLRPAARILMSTQLGCFQKLLAAAVVDDGGQVDNGEEESQRHPVWAVVADIGGGTTDYALMQIHGFYYKVITTDGNKILGGRDIDIRLGEVMTRILQEKYPSLDLTSSVFQQKLRIECENAKIVLSKKEQYDLTVEYVDEDEHVDSLPLGYLLTRDEFEGYVGDILDDMVKPIDSLLSRAGGKLRETLGQGIKPENIEDLYLVGGTSHIPKLKKLLLRYGFYESIRDNPYWTSRKNNLELIEPSSINKVSLV